MPKSVHTWRITHVFLLLLIFVKYKSKFLNRNWSWNIILGSKIDRQLRNPIIYKFTMFQKNLLRH
jgi:hypothetical protein